MVDDGCQWFLVVLSGCQWFAVVLSGFQCFSLVLSGSQWFSLVLNDSQSSVSFFSLITSLLFCDMPPGPWHAQSVNDNNENIPHCIFQFKCVQVCKCHLLYLFLLNLNHN